MARTISHTQYEQLRDYADGYDRWINGGAPRGLVSAGYITAAHHDRTMFHLTSAGALALAAYQAKYGIRLPA
jgi:hypothetical protein